MSGICRMDLQGCLIQVGLKVRVHIPVDWCLFEKMIKEKKVKDKGVQRERENRGGKKANYSNLKGNMSISILIFITAHLIVSE